MKNKIILILLFLFPSLSHSQWQITNVGNPGTFVTGLSVGQARNDGVNRVFGLTAGGNAIGGFTYSGGTWTQTDTISLPYYAERMAIGNGRNDGTLRIYSGCFWANPGNGMEFSYTGGAWQYSDMGGTSQQLITVAIGPGRNDDTMRVYFGCGSSPPMVSAREFSYSTGTWNIMPIGDAHGGFGLGIGPGRNDGVNRVYKDQDITGNINEYTYSGGAWNTSLVATRPTQIRRILIGDGRNDGVQRLYCYARYTGLLEYTYSGGNWSNTATVPIGSEAWDVTLGDGRNDGKMRFYVPSYSTNSVYEISYESGNWNVVNIGSPGGGYIYTVFLGKGRAGDNKNYIYVGTRNGGIYEFAYPSVGISEEQILNPKSQIPNFTLFQNSPNPFRTETSIRFQIPDSIFQSSNLKSGVSIKIYDITGKLIRELPITNYKLPITEVIWNGKDKRGNDLPSGIYFYTLTVDGISQTKRSTLLR